MPQEVWDCHVHVIDHRWPLAASRTYDPPTATSDALVGHLASIKAARAVLVQPSVYGFDNGCLLEALAQSAGRWRGIAVPAPGTSPQALARMHDAGVRGVRCNLLNTGGITLEEAHSWWPWMLEHGWHIQLQIDATRTNVSAMLDRIPVPVVIDHMGFPGRQASFEALAPLVDLVGLGRLRVKLSAPYRISRGPPPHADALRLAEAFLSAGPENCLWASDWPHTDHAGNRISDGEWLAEIRELAGESWAALCASAASLYDPVVF